MSSDKRIVLTTYGTLGDLHPYLALALELRARGHNPVIASCKRHQQTVESVGLEFRSIRPDLPADDLNRHRRLTEPRRGLERVIRELMMPVIRETYEDLIAVVQQHKADLLISQILIFAAPIIAEKTRIRWISTELQPGAFMSAYDPPVMAPMPGLAKLRGLGSTFHKPLFGIAKLPSRTWSQPVTHLRRELNLPPGHNPLFAGRHSPRLVLGLFSSVLGAPQPDWPNNVRVTGFPFYDETNSALPSQLENFLSEGEPPIVFTLGSSAVLDPEEFYSESVAAISRLNTRAVLLVGNNPITYHLPRNIIAIPYAPYKKIFRAAAVIVHHGGVGTTGQALRAGKPMLVMPFGGDQYDNGARIERLGVGRMIMRKKYTSERVAADLIQLLTDSKYREQAVKIGSVVEREDGVRVACDAIEEQFG